LDFLSQSGRVRFRAALQREDFSATFFLIVFASTAGLCLYLFRWQLVSSLSVFVEPFIELVVWAFYVVAVIAAILRAIVARNRSMEYRLLPLIVAAISTSIFLFVPFTALELKLDFREHLEPRTAAAQRILIREAGAKATPPWQPRSEKLSRSEAGLSEDGEVMVALNNKDQFVFFYTFRGILEHYSGFVYSATDAPPEDSDFGSTLVEVDHLRKNWYWVASR
jgi:hypothetical protein